jgi:hypothetical protein
MISKVSRHTHHKLPLWLHGHIILIKDDFLANYEKTGKKCELEHDDWWVR